MYHLYNNKHDKSLPYSKWFLFILLLVAASSRTAAIALELGTFVDLRDSTSYQTAKFGDDWWMVENLNYKSLGVHYGQSGPCSRFIRGDTIENESDKYGRLYSFQEAEQACPTGWHLPSDVEFQALINRFGGESRETYDSLIMKTPGSFSVRLSGHYKIARDYSCDSITINVYEGRGGYESFWTSKEERLTIDGYRHWVYFDSQLGTHGCCIRCVKDRVLSSRVDSFELANRAFRKSDLPIYLGNAEAEARLHTVFQTEKTRWIGRPNYQNDFSEYGVYPKNWTVGSVTL